MLLDKQRKRSFFSERGSQKFCLAFSSFLLGLWPESFAKLKFHTEDKLCFCCCSFLFVCLIVFSHRDGSTCQHMVEVYFYVFKQQCRGVARIFSEGPAQFFKFRGNNCHPLPSPPLKPSPHRATVRQTFMTDEARFAGAKGAKL